MGLGPKGLAVVRITAQLSSVHIPPVLTPSSIRRREHLPLSSLAVQRDSAEKAILLWGHVGCLYFWNSGVTSGIQLWKEAVVISTAVY